MTAYELKERHLNRYPNSHFFDRDTLKFFGETMSRMSVGKYPVLVTDACGVQRKAYCLSSLQRKAPGGPRRAYHYFDTNTYEHIIT